jgi:hypothetical protein
MMLPTQFGTISDPWSQSLPPILAQAPVCQDNVATTYIIDNIHTSFPISSAFLRVGTGHRTCDLFDRNANKILASFASDPDLVFLERDEQDVDVKGRKADGRVGVEFGNSGSEASLLLLREGSRVSVDAPERHVED